MQASLPLSKPQEYVTPLHPIDPSHPHDDASQVQVVRGSARLASLPLYVFARLDAIKKEVRASGLELIDLGMGNPDQPTPPAIIAALQAAVADPANHGYPSFEGKASFREAVAQWMQRRYNTRVNPETQVQPLIGSKEGIANLITAVLSEGDTALLPSLYYPTYMRATVMTGATPHIMPLLPENNFLPDLKAIPEAVLENTRLMLLNYPNNPTGVEAPREFLAEALALAERYNFIIATDMAYGEVCYEGYKPVSILELPGAEHRTIEFHSFSKSFHMAGWRLGFAVGAPSVVRLLYLNKTTCDYGVCNAIQDAGTYALNHAEDFITPMCEEYQRRRDYLVGAFRSLGWPTTLPKASFYLWLPVPEAYADADTFCERVMRETGVVFTPGSAFGESGRRYFRVSLVSPIATLEKAIATLEAHNIRYA